MSVLQRWVIFAGYCAAIVAAAIVIANNYATASNNGVMLGIAGALLALFAVVVALREYWIVTMQRRLKRNASLGRAEAEATRQRLSAVLESTTDSVLVIDRDWHVTYFNRNAATTINQRDKLTNGVSLWELFPAAATSGEGDHYKRAFTTGEPEEFEIFVQDRQIWLRIQAYPSADGLSIFFRDISAEKQARDEVEYLARHV